MGGIILALSLHVFMAWAGTALRLPVSCLISKRSQKKKKLLSRGSTSLRTLEVPSSDIASDISCYQCNFIGFSKPLQANSATVPQIRPLILPSTSFRVHESPYRSTLHSLRYWERCSVN